MFWLLLIDAVNLSQVRNGLLLGPGLLVNVPQPQGPAHFSRQQQKQRRGIPASSGPRNRSAAAGIADLTEIHCID